MSIIDLKHIDYKTIKNDLYDYIKTREDFENIEKALGSNLDMFLSVIAGYATYNSYKYKMLREETYIDTAKLDSSIFHLAKTFGFNIKRPFAPMIEVVYNDIPTIELSPGTILGNYDDYDIVYLGKLKIIEKGDKIPAYVGFFKEIDYTPLKIIEYIDLQPEESAIHNEVWIKDNNGFNVITKSAEDYLVYNIPSDFSSSNISTNILLYDKDNYFGNLELENQNIKILYLETDGEMQDLDLERVKLDNRFYQHQILTKGARGHTIEEIRKQTPFYFQTLRRMVTAKDHKYILESIEFLKSVSVERDNGLPKVYKVSLNDSCIENDSLLNDVTLKINIYNRIHTVKLVKGMTLAEIMTAIKDNIQSNRNINVNIDSQNNLIIDTKDGRIINDFFIDFTGCNFNIEVIDDGKVPLCCTIKVYYIKQDTVDDPILLTDYEMAIISEKIYPYKMVGTKLLFIPAQPVKKDLSIKIRLTDYKYFEEVRLEVLNIVRSYELQLDKDFLYGEFLSRVANIEIYDTEEMKKVSPITYIEPNQEMFDININNKYYIKFENVEVLIG